MLGLVMHLGEGLCKRHWWRPLKRGETARFAHGAQTELKLEKLYKTNRPGEAPCLARVKPYDSRRQSVDANSVR